ncbi:hypothetical protein WJX73_002847 [Symbiochloris irregularis]|uniref:Amino acid transporter transmembrane domain-containing protein n=1 Tax=Symbiochloris irregularis TaxID=706552 RepID=A0AAW1PMK6_9CHLO
MVFLGWPGGTVALVLSWLISLYTLHQLCDLHEFNGHRFNRYHELGVYAFGKVWGNIAVITPQLIVMVGLGITYTVTGGQSLKRFWAIVCHKGADGTCATDFGLSAWIVVFTGVHLILIQCPNFNSLRPVSLLAAVMSMGYSTIAIGGSIKAGKQPGTEYNLNGYSTGAGILNVFNSLGIVAFAYGGHNVVLEIQSSMKSPKKTAANPQGLTYTPFMRGVFLAYAIVAWCYFGVSFTGYHSFGNHVEDNVLASIPGPKWMIAMADMFVVFHVIGSYQVYTMPVMDMIEVQWVRRGHGINLATRLVYRTIYVIIIAFFAIIVP